MQLVKQVRLSWARYLALIFISGVLAAAGLVAVVDSQVTPTQADTGITVVAAGDIACQTVGDARKLSTFDARKVSRSG
jgi:hypothetical protein